MTIERKSNIEAALLGELLTIVRGSQALHIPAGEIGDLHAIISQLIPNESNSRVMPAETQVTESRTAALRPQAVQTAQPKQLRRGRLWEGVRQYLSQQDRALGYKTLLKFVKHNHLTDRDPNHALKIALGKKVSTGELIRTPSGRYTVPTATGSAMTSATGLARRKKSRHQSASKHRPGQLWRNMRLFLGQYPSGQTREQIVDAAKAGNWTMATSTEHAVKICLTRVADQIEWLDNGMVRLAGIRTPKKLKGSLRKKEAAKSEIGSKTPTTNKSNVRRRKKTTKTTPSDGPFEAASLYHLPRSRQPR